MGFQNPLSGKPNAWDQYFVGSVVRTCDLKRPPHKIVWNHFEQLNDEAGPKGKCQGEAFIKSY
jgi:hypothetical protein